MLQLVSVLLILGGLVLLVAFGRKLFAYLGQRVDEMRPTADHEARPGHQNLGVGMFCIMMPIAFVVFYDPSAILAEDSLVSALLPALALLLIIIATPLAGVIGVLRWRNACLTLSGGLLTATDLFGKSSPPSRVISAKMRPPVRNPGRIDFELSGGWVFADTSWINIRRMYEEVRALGATAEPWRERATMKDVWSN